MSGGAAFVAEPAMREHEFECVAAAQLGGLGRHADLDSPGRLGHQMDFADAVGEHLELDVVADDAEVDRAHGGHGGLDAEGVTELEDIRQASKKDYLERGIKLTQMPFLIKAVAMALKTNPAINASIDEENAQIIYKKYVNVGIAVDTDRGLLVPSLRGADKLSIPETARALGTIGDSARANNFKLDDLRGSTFTISNLGAIGGQYSTPIVNTPEVAILLVGRSRKMPVVVNDEVVVRLMMPLSLSYDHRLVDGATAARFLNDVISYLQSPSRLLIAP